MHPPTTESIGEYPGSATPSRDLWILGLLLVFPSTGFVQKYTGIAGLAAYAAAVLAVVFLSVRLARRFAPWLEHHFRKLAVLAIAGLAAGFVVLHPLEDRKGPGTVMKGWKWR